MKPATRALLASGLVLGPLFYVVFLAQALTRPGFDLVKHPMSLLALGEGGWVQTANFVVVGVLGLLLALGLARAYAGTRGGRATAVLVAVFGAGLLLAGLSPSDAAYGFPPGTPDAAPATMSVHAMLHGLGFVVSFGALTAALFLLAARWRREGRRGLATAARVAGAATPVFVLVGLAVPRVAGLAFALAAVGPFTMLALAAASARAAPRGTSGAATSAEA